MGRVLWSVREGQAGQFDGPEIMAGFRSVDHEPRRGDLLVLPDGSGPWRVIDRTIAAHGEPSGNVLLVELFGAEGRLDERRAPDRLPRAG